MASSPEASGEEMEVFARSERQAAFTYSLLLDVKGIKCFLNNQIYSLTCHYHRYLTSKYCHLPCIEACYNLYSMLYLKLWMNVCLP